MKRQTIWGIISLIVVFVLISVGTHALRSTDHPTVVASIDGDTDEISGTPKDYTAQITSALGAPKVMYQISSSTPQFVLLSFDGSKDVSMLDETLAFQQKMVSENKPLHFTYFINAAYFLTSANSGLYKSPQQASGTSMIGFSNTSSDIALRVQEFNKAFTLGNEIGSHSAGHFDGSGWSYDEWKQEFTSFMSLLTNVQQNNPSTHIDTPIFTNTMDGFRAPNLGVNDNLYRVLGEHGFTHDSSGVNASDAWPTKDSYGVWHIPLGTIYLGTDKRPVISMDYSIWTRESQAKEQAVKGTALWNQYYTDVESAYMNYFNTNYNENRSPIVIADHFSKWNDGVYWEAMKAFAENVCGRPNVQCVTFKDLVKYLTTTGAPARL